MLWADLFDLCLSDKSQLRTSPAIKCFWVLEGCGRSNSSFSADANASPNSRFPSGSGQVVGGNLLRENLGGKVI
jgi:hypothetical protein